MKRLDSDQKRTLRKIFHTNLLGLGSMPLGQRWMLMHVLDRALIEMDKLVGSSPAYQGVARKCSACRVLTRRGIYHGEKRKWLCLECGAKQIEEEQQRD